MAKKDEKIKKDTGTDNNNSGSSDKGGAAGGNGNVVKPIAKISKISLTPSRKINLGNYETLECQAGIELTFEEPMLIEIGRAHV